MISLRLTFFGSPQIHLNDRLVQLKNRKAVALLAYLVLSQLPQSREKLMSVFWPEFSQERASANLRVTLHLIKKHLTDDWLDIRRHEVEVKDSPTFWVDVLEFQHHFDHVSSHDPGLSTTCAGCLPLLLTAIDLYRDDFLRGFTLPDSPAFDEWQAFHTDLFRENLRESLHRVVRYYTLHHELLSAIEYARRWIAFFPWSETAHRELMRLYGLNHQRPAALQQYQECARMLRKEFGVEPEQETQELYEAIRNQKDLSPYPPPDRWGLAAEPPKPPPAAEPPKSPPAAEPPKSPPAAEPPKSPPAAEPPKSPPAAEPPKSPPGRGRGGFLTENVSPDSATHPLPLPGGELVAFGDQRGEHPNNLPAQITSFIGREAEVTTVSNMLSQPDVRLLTLTGSGGSGKTRLSLQVAAKMLAEMADGVFFVSLAPINNPELVISTIAHTLGLHIAGNTSPFNVLKTYLQKKQLLLVLDNFEQILTAAPVLIDLLTAAAGLKILVTSRTVLRISGEHTYLVPPLRVPDLANLPSFQELTRFEAIRLFTERAKAIYMDFALTEENAPAVAEICARLDGLPLAIELATAHVSMFSPKAMLNQLDHPLHFLTGGARDLPPRQQTLRNTIVWSYHLLNEEEQILFRRLAVFVGGWTLEAAEAVCACADAPPTAAVRPELVEGLGQGSGQVVDVLTCLESLLDKNLITRIKVNGEQRFSILETIREYALEQLTASGEAETIRHHHARFFLALAEEAEPKWHTAEHGIWLSRLEMELGNLRTALAWSIDTMIEIGLRLAGALALFWAGSAYHSEGREWLAKALAKSEACRIDIAGFRAKALTSASMLARFQGDVEATRSLAEESIALARELNDKNCLASAMLWLGISMFLYDDSPGARVLIKESIALCRHIHNTRLLTEALYWHGVVTLQEPDYEQARASTEECLALAQETGDINVLAGGALNLGRLAFEQGDYITAQAFYEKSLKHYQEIDDKIGIPDALNYLGDALRVQGSHEHAMTCYTRSMKMSQESGHKAYIAWSLQGFGEIALSRQQWHEAHQYFVESLALFGKQALKQSLIRSLMGLAGVAEGQQRPERAVQLVGAMEALLGMGGRPYWEALFVETEYERLVTALRNTLGEEAFATEVAKGREMTLEQAIAYGMDSYSFSEK